MEAVSRGQGRRAGGRDLSAYRIPGWVTFPAQYSLASRKTCSSRRPAAAPPGGKKQNHTGEQHALHAAAQNGLHNTQRFPHQRLTHMYL